MKTVHAQLERDGSGVLNLGPGQGEPIKIIGGDLEEARMRVRALVGDHARTSRADVLFTAADPDGTWDMVVLQDGNLVSPNDYHPQETLTSPARKSILRFPRLPRRHEDRSAPEIASSQLDAMLDGNDATLNLDVDSQARVTDTTTWTDSNASQPRSDGPARAAATRAPARGDRGLGARRAVGAVADRFTRLDRRTRFGLIAVVIVTVFFLVVSAIVTRPSAMVTRSPTPVPAPSDSADGCIGGSDLERAVDQAADLATQSTITQNGVTVPSPTGAAAAAAAFARLRSTLPPPSNRDELIDGILASNATSLARQAIPAEPGWETQLDMTQGRWQVTSGNGQTAGLDLLLTTQAAKDGQPVAPVQFTVAMDLVVENGQWRLRDIGTAQTSPEVLAGANPYINGEGCS